MHGKGFLLEPTYYSTREAVHNHMGCDSPFARERSPCAFYNIADNVIEENGGPEDYDTDIYKRV